MKKTVSILAIFLFTFATGILHAQDIKMSIQGILKNLDGTIVADGNYQMQFKIYNAATAGTQLWSETNTSVNVSGGVYNSYLGSTPAGLLSLQALPYDETYYIGVTVVGSQEMTPRLEITGSAYTIRSNHSNNADTATYATRALFANGVTFDVGNAGIANDVATGDLVLTADPSDQVRVDDANLKVEKNLFVDGYARFDANNDHITIGGTHPTDPYFDATGSNLYIQAYNTSGSRIRFNNGLLIHPLATSNDDLHIGQSSASAAYIEASSNNLNLKAATGGRIYMSSGIEANTTLTSNTGTVATFYLNGSTASTNTSTGTLSYSFLSNDRIKAASFHASSDRRIKKGFQLADGATSIDLINKLKITKYKFIDETKGKEEITGVVAQEVKEVLPNAVNLNKGFIPSVFANAKSIVQHESTTTVVMNEAHGFVVGDNIKVVTMTEYVEKEVISIEGNSFTISKLEDSPENLFVYGKEISDFHNVDFNQITSLAVASIQELSKQIASLKAEAENTKAELINTKSAHNEEIKAILLRLNSLENKNDIAEK